PGPSPATSDCRCRSRLSLPTDPFSTPRVEMRVLVENSVFLAQIPQLPRTCRGRSYCVDQHRTKTMAFQFGHGGDGRSAGRCHLVVQDRRVFAGVLDELGCAENRLSRQTKGSRTWNALFYAGLRQCLDEHVDVG